MLSTNLGSLFMIAVSAISSVRAHGWVQGVLVDKKDYYPGYLPWEDPYYSPPREKVIRKFPDNGPVEDLTSIDIQCNGKSKEGKGTAPSPYLVTASAGSSIDLQWTTDWPSSHVGPVVTYMAKAPGSVTNFSPGTDAVWFKIAEEGLTANGWAATDGLYAHNSTVTVDIPKNLVAGEYIMRHEIIALHGAFDYPGVQFYPSCIQFKITGSGSAFPTELVSFPGAYTVDTPGIVFNVYGGATEYPIPGPAVWTGN